MQLFRQQAIDYQHRLYGEVLLVPPLRWSFIVALLLVLLAATALFLTWGSYSRTVAVSGVSLSADRVALQVPVSVITQIAAGQSVRILPTMPTRQGRSLLHGVIEQVGAAPAGNTSHEASLFVPVTVRLTPLTPHVVPEITAPMLAPGTPVDARIVLAARSLLQQITAPEGTEIAQ